MIRKSLIALASASLVLGSTAAAAAPAQIADTREASPVAESEQLMGGVGWIIALLVAAGVVLVVVSDDEEDDPASP